MPYKQEAPPYFCTAFLNDFQNNHGITENLWILPEPGGAHAGARDIFADIMEKRLALTTNEIVLKAIRVSDASVKGDTLVKEYLVTDGVGTYAGGSASGNLPINNCLNIRFQGNDVLFHSTHPLHGLPLDTISPDDAELFVSSMEWDTAFEAYVNAIVASCALVKSTPSRPMPGVIPVLTSTIVQDLQHGSDVRWHRVGRPFGLAVGRYASR